MIIMAYRNKVIFIQILINKQSGKRKNMFPR